MQDYELELDKEFEYDGRSADWAPGHNRPRLWDDEDELIELPNDDPMGGIVPHNAIALAPDGRYLAVATNTVIRIYNVESLAIFAELVGHEQNIRTLVFLKHPLVVSPPKRGTYILVSESTWLQNNANIHTWTIDPAGHLVDKDMPRMSFPLNGPLRLFGSSFSHDSNRMIYIAHAGTTRKVMRSAVQLPRPVVLDMATGRETCRLKGHTDAIMWAGWSLDDTVIATASWDGTYRVWDVKTGECKNTISPTNGQK